MPERELESIQKNYFAELHALQDELAVLLQELPEVNPLRHRTVLLHTA